MTDASWVRNVGKLIERGRRISSERASKRAPQIGKVSLGETFPAPDFIYVRSPTRSLFAEQTDSIVRN